MGLDEELETIEDGAETEAEQIDQETELEDVEEFQNDEEFDPSDDETDLEEAYEGFFAEEGPDGEGETSLDGEDGGLAAVASQAAGIDLSEEPCTPVGSIWTVSDEADEEAQLYENGSLDSYDADALNEDGDATAGSVPEVDEANALEELEDGQDDDVQDVVIIEPSAEDDGYELVELELDDDDIVRYIEDEDGDVIGFVLMEDGEEAEYYYVEEDEEEAEEEDNPYDLGITKEGVAEATNDMNAIYKDGIAVAAELKGAFDDIKSALDFTSFLKK